MDFPISDDIIPDELPFLMQPFLMQQQVTHSHTNRNTGLGNNHLLFRSSESLDIIKVVPSSVLSGVHLLISTIAGLTIGTTL